MSNQIWYLSAFNIFENFTKTELESVTKILHLREFNKKDFIALPSNSERRIYFLIKGKAKLTRVEEDGKELLLDILTPGEIFGPMQSESKYSSTLVVALNKCIVGHIHETDFNQLQKEKPNLCLAINKVLGSRLVKLENRLEELLFRDVPSRLARLLLRLSDEYPYQLVCGVRIDVVLTQQDMANLIGATRQSTSSTINRFKREGWIEAHGNHICVHNRKALQDLAQ